MISENILRLRKEKKLSQEQTAEKIGVSRQTIAKWENGDSVPDIHYSSLLAKLFEVTLDDLVNKDSEELIRNLDVPTGKYIFGLATVGDKGQIVIPIEARKIFHIKPGDKLMFLGDIHQGLALMPQDFFIAAMEVIKQQREDII